MKRILALVLMLAMLATIPTALAADDFVDGKFTTTQHITVEVFNRNNDGGSDPTNNVWTEYLKKGMLEKYNIEVEYVSVGRWSEVDDLNNLLAIEEAPDVSYTYSAQTIQTFAGMGKVVDLAPYLNDYNEYLGDLKALIGDENLFYDLDPAEGTVWMLQAAMPNNGRITTFIRKDWCDKLGLALPTTTEEFYNCLVAFRDNAELLLGADADKMVPYTTSTDIGWRNDLLSISFVAEDIDDDTLFVYGYDDRHLLYPGYKEGIRTLNKWYNEGLVWKDFGLYSDSTEEDNMMKAGYVGAFMHNWDYPFRNGEDCINLNLQRNVGPDAMFYPVDTFENAAGITRKFLGSKVGSDRKIFVPSTCENPLAALLYINFISSAETIKFLQTGLEGTNFNMTADGAYEILPATGEWVKNSGNNIDYTMTCNGLYLGDATDATTSLSYPGIPAEIVTLACDYSKTNGRIAKHYNVGAIEAETEVGSSLTSKRDALLTKAVTAAEADFDSVFDAGMADYLASGGQDIIDERIEKLAEVYGVEFNK